MQTMLANVFHGVDDIRVETVPKPSAGPGEAVLKITATTICGTDLHIVRGEYPVEPGLIIGHEPVGVIEELDVAIEALGTQQTFDPTMLMTHKFSLEDIKDGYELFGNRQDGVLKVLITP